MKERRQFKHIKVFLNIFIFLFASVIITFLFPLKAEFKFEFSEGKPWMHEDFYAPFDFSIKKSNEQIALETDSLLASLPVYYHIDKSIKEQVFKDLDELTNLNQEDTNTHLINEFTEDIKKLYKTGIYDEQNMVSNDGYFMLVNGNFAEEKDLSYYFLYRNVKKEFQNKYNNLRFLDLRRYIRTNIVLDTETNNKAKNGIDENVSKTYGFISSGEKVIDKGEMIDSELYQKLLSLKMEYEKHSGIEANIYILFIGRFMIVSLLLLFLYLFILSYKKELFLNTKHLIFILLLIILFVLTSKLIFIFNNVSIYIVPFAIIPVIVRTFFDGRIALFVSIITILLIANMVPNPYEFTFIQIAVSMTVLFSLHNINKRSKLFTTSAFVVITYSLIYLSFGIVKEGSISNVNTNNFIWFLSNGLLLLSTYPLTYIFERVFGFLSDVTLMELADTNQPLLRNLSEKAPGTFQHSVQVANIAEELTRKLNGNPLLARTGALYHDIGKTLNPHFFIENQAGDINPHDRLDFDKSAEIIISHVNAGVELAKKHNLPKQIVDFIKMHHGETKVQYFYKSFIKKYPDKVPDLANFSYPGPKPMSKETAIVMVSDSVEAAARSLKKINDDTIAPLVDSIIDNLINDKQFMYTNLTFNDITVIKESLKHKISNIYHARIEYPK